MQILERIRRKRKFNEDVEELEDSFKASYGDADEVVLLVVETVVEVCKKKSEISPRNKELD